jgi:hypothetical protein
LALARRPNHRFLRRFGVQSCFQCDSDAAYHSQRESLASKDMHRVVFVEENGSVDAPASNLAMV